MGTDSRLGKFRLQFTDLLLRRQRSDLNDLFAGCRCFGIFIGDHLTDRIGTGSRFRFFGFELVRLGLLLFGLFRFQFFQSGLLDFLLCLGLFFLCVGITCRCRFWRSQDAVR